MHPRSYLHLTRISLVFSLLMLLAVTACQQAFVSSFDSAESAGSWARERRPDVTGEVVNGVYVLSARSPAATPYWATAGERFEDGVYEVEAAQIGGVLNSGYGLIFRLDEATDSFYLFEISGDGYVWIGWCGRGCAEQRTLLGDWGFPSPTVRTGLNAVNRLRVVADGPNMTFYLNDVELGRVFDATLSAGDIALMVENLGQGPVSAAFDNARVSPLDR